MVNQHWANEVCQCKKIGANIIWREACQASPRPTFIFKTAIRNRLNPVPHVAPMEAPDGYVTARSVASPGSAGSDTSGSRLRRVVVSDTTTPSVTYSHSINRNTGESEKNGHNLDEEEWNKILAGSVWCTKVPMVAHPLFQWILYEKGMFFRALSFFQKATLLAQVLSFLSLTNCRGPCFECR